MWIPDCAQDPCTLRRTDRRTRAPPAPRSRAPPCTRPRPVVLVVVALRVQRAVHQQVRVVGGQVDLLLLRLALDHRRAQHQVGLDLGLLHVVEREHVGGVVLLAVLAVERAAFVLADDAHRDRGRQLEAGADPARDLVARQQRAVRGVGELQAQLQRRASGVRAIRSVLRGRRAGLPGRWPAPARGALGALGRRPAARCARAAAS